MKGQGYITRQNTLSIRMAALAKYARKEFGLLTPQEEEEEDLGEPANEMEISNSA